MQVELGDVVLPIEDVGEVDVPVNQLAGPIGVEIVVIAEEAALAVVGDVDVVAGAGPEDVVEDIGFGGAAADIDVVAGRSVHRVVDDLHRGDTVHIDAGLRVVVDHVVGDELAVLGLDADGLAANDVVLDGPAEIEADGIGLDDVGHVEVGAAERAAAGDADAVVVDVLVLQLGAAELHAGAVLENLIGLGAAGAEVGRGTGGKHRAGHGQRIVVDEGVEVTAVVADEIHGVGNGTSTTGIAKLALYCCQAPPCASISGDDCVLSDRRRAVQEGDA